MFIKANGATTATETMTWDKESRMLTNSLANASYVYNGFDTRVSKTVSSTTTTFKRAGADPASPVVSDVVGGSTTTNYLPGISSRVGSTSTFNHSGIKNGILQTNSSQSNTATKRYDAFGNELSSSGTWQTRFDYGGSFGYQNDSESSYKLLGHRYYDPEIGRFLTRDPAKDGRNWHSYCVNSPVASADPTGLKVAGLKVATPEPVIPSYLSELWEGVKYTISGVDVTDSRGHTVKVGGLQATLISRENAVTYGSKIHLNDFEVFERYIQNEYWQMHEEYHLLQEVIYGAWYLPKIGLQYTVVYLSGGGHDDVPMEVEANAWGNPMKQTGGNFIWPGSWQ